MEKLKRVTNVKDIGPEGRVKEFTIARKYNFEKEKLLRLKEKMETELAEVTEMLTYFEKTK